MKKYRYPCAVLLFLLLMGAHHSYGQKLRPAIPQPSQFLPAIKKEIAKHNNSATARTLSCSADSLVFTRQSQIDSFPITNPGCTVLRELRIYGSNASPSITNLDSLYSITEITGFFEVDSTQVTNLDGLTGLQRTAWLWLGYNPLMTDVMPPNLIHVGSVLLNQLPLFTSFSGFTQNLTSTRHGYLWIFNNVGITNFAGLESLDSVDKIGVFGPPGLSSFQGLQNVVYCHDIGLFGCSNLTDVSALSGITELPWGSLKINYNYQLASWNGLQNITRIGSILEVMGSPVTSLSGLNPNLIIENSNNPTEDTLRIEDNFQLAACSFNPLCEYLDRSAAAVIQNNATGCSSIAEVLANCGSCTGGALKTWNGSIGGDWDNPANWTPAGVPQLCDSVVIPTGLVDYPYANNNISIGALTMEPGSSIAMNSYDLLIKGRPSISDADIYSGNTLTVTRPRDLMIEH
ncbi:MAG: hypothetical protein ACXWC7_15360, partial [Chitinophagaceae bacterium]